jgi:hypothetical protein
VVGVWCLVFGVWCLVFCGGLLIPRPLLLGVPKRRGERKKGRRSILGVPKSIGKVTRVDLCFSEYLGEGRKEERRVDACSSECRGASGKKYGQTFASRIIEVKGGKKKYGRSFALGSIEAKTGRKSGTCFLGRSVKAGGGACLGFGQGS